MSARSDAARLFDKPMRSHGVEVEATQLRRALNEWEPSKGHLALGFGVERCADPTFTPTGKEPFWRIADRMVQKMRKAGVIEHLGGGKWKWSDQ